MTLRPTQPLIFGDHKAGTPLMRTAPTMGLDLPLKVLAWADEQGKVQVIRNHPAYLSQRHALDAGDTKHLAAVEGLIDATLKWRRPTVRRGWSSHRAVARAMAAKPSLSLTKSRSATAILGVATGATW